MHTKFCSENLKERDHFRELGKEGRILLLDFREIECEDMD
jgi:hypothetical protein